MPGLGPPEPNVFSDASLRGSSQPHNMLGSRAAWHPGGHFTWRSPADVFSLLVGQCTAKAYFLCFPFYEGFRLALTCGEPMVAPKAIMSASCVRHSLQSWVPVSVGIFRSTSPLRASGPSGGHIARSGCRCARLVPGKTHAARQAQQPGSAQQHSATQPQTHMQTRTERRGTQTACTKMPARRHAQKHRTFTKDNGSWCWPRLCAEARGSSSDFICPYMASR